MPCPVIGGCPHSNPSAELSLHTPSLLMCILLSHEVICDAFMAHPYNPESSSHVKILHLIISADVFPKSAGFSGSRARICSLWGLLAAYCTNHTHSAEEESQAQQKEVTCPRYNTRCSSATGCQGNKSLCTGGEGTLRSRRVALGRHRKGWWQGSGWHCRCHQGEGRSLVGPGGKC